MERETVELPGNSAEHELNSKSKKCVCEGPNQMVPGEAEALSTMNEVCGALQEIREIAEKMDLSWLADSQEKLVENPDDDAKETPSQTDVETGPPESRAPDPAKDPEGAVATEKLEIVASRLIRRYGRKSMRITLSARADAPAKDNDEKGFPKPGTLSRPNQPEEVAPASFNDNATSRATGTQTENTGKKTWNFFKFLFGSRKRK